MLAIRLSLIITGVFFLTVSCGRAETQDQFQSKTRSIDNPDVEIELTRMGAQVRAVIQNHSLTSICIYRSQWIVGNEHLLTVTGAHGDIAFKGELPSLIGQRDEKPLVIMPNQGISGLIDLNQHFDAAKWTGVEIAYDPLFADCV